LKLVVGRLTENSLCPQTCTCAVTLSLMNKALVQLRNTYNRLHSGTLHSNNVIIHLALRCIPARDPHVRASITVTCHR